MLLDLKLRFDSLSWPDAMYEPIVGPPGEARTLSVQSPTYVTVGGRRDEVRVLTGGWCVLEPWPDVPGAQKSLRFWVEFPEGASKGDVSIPEGRVIVAIGMWDDGLLATKLLMREKENVELKLVKLQQHQRQPQVFTIRQLFKRVAALDESARLERRLRQLREQTETPVEGWAEADPGVVVRMSAMPGSLSIKAAKRFLGKQYLVIGSCRMKQRGDSR